MEGILQKTLEAHRLIRHDFMNHLQVISGYIQLGQPEKVREYIKRVCGALERFKCLASIEAPFLQSLLVYFLCALGEKDSFNLEVQDKISLKEEEDRDLAGLVGAAIDHVYDMILKNELQCRIYIKEPYLIDICLYAPDCACAVRNAARGVIMKHLDRLKKSYPRYTLTVRDEEENKGFYLLIAGE